MARRALRFLAAIASLALWAGAARGYHLVLEQPGSTASDVGAVRAAGMPLGFLANSGIALHRALRRRSRRARA
jgi:hypothetical protein